MSSVEDLMDRNLLYRIVLYTEYCSIRYTVEPDFLHTVLSGALLRNMLCSISVYAVGQSPVKNNLDRYIRIIFL